MMSTLPLFALKYAGFALLTLSFGTLAFSALSENSIVNTYYRRYVTELNRIMKLIFIVGTSGEKIVVLQVLGAAVIAGAGIFLALEYWYVGVLLSIVGPYATLRYKHRKHVLALEDQIDSMLLALANALKTVPSPAAALAAIVPVAPQPMNLEIDRLLKEVRVGTTLEQALLNMTSRIQSPEIDAGLSALLIGLQVGGNLPEVLESTAHTIREMHRLQGVVKTKTAEARAQLWVLALFPFVIVYMFNTVDPNYFTPLKVTFLGNLIAAVAGIFWMTSLLVARKVLQVDL